MEELRVEILQGFFFLFTVSLHWEREGYFWVFFGWLVGMWKVLFFFYLFHCAKDVSIILLEAPYTSQATQSAREFISVKNSKICKSKRQFPPGSGTMGKHQAKRNMEEPSFILLTGDLRQHRSSVQTVITFLSIYSFRLSASWKTGKHTTQCTAKDHWGKKHRKSKSRQVNPYPSWTTTSDAHLYPTELVFTSGTD